MKWAIERIKRGDEYTVFLESLNGRYHKEDLEIDGKMILN
jgi:hypothetical protein